MHIDTAIAIADEVLGLINSRPHTPTMDELVAAVLAAHAAPAHSVMEHPVVRETLAAVEDFEAVDQLYGEFDAKAEDEREARLQAAAERRDSVVRRIWSRAPNSVADIVARAIIFESMGGGGCFNERTGELQHLNPERIAAGGQPTVCDTSAAAHLLDAIRRVLGGRRYPRQSAYLRLGSATPE